MYFCFLTLNPFMRILQILLNGILYSSYYQQCFCHHVVKNILIPTLRNKQILCIFVRFLTENAKASLRMNSVHTKESDLKRLI